MEDNQQQFNKWLKSEVVTAFAIGSVVAGIVVWFLSPINELNTQMAVMQNQLNNIKNNDLTHIEAGITTQNARLDDLQEQVFDIAKSLAAVAAFVKK